ncbi:MAG: polysaccharide biosynthesis tyrosine autokinase [Chloroflexota bacterium]|nr:polysaccharide biosynthesis tyrosine autokinase [Chloroflexota bacterium]
MKTLAYDTHDTSVAQVARMFRRWWWIILLFPTIAAGAAYWFSAQQPPVYTASATLFISQASSSSGDVSAAKQLTKSYSELVLSRPVLDQVISDLQLDSSARQLESQMRVTPVRDTQLMEISTRAANPETAAAITNSIANAFVNWIAAQQSATLGQNTLALRDSMNAAKSDLDKTSAELAELRASAQPLTTATAARAADLEALAEQYQSRYDNLASLLQRSEFAPRNQVILTTPAEAALAPSEPNPLRNAGIALVLDLGLVVAALFAFEHFTNRVRQPEDVRRNMQLPVLGGIPWSRRRSGVELLAEPHSPMSESIRTLRTTLQFAANRRSIGTLVITSPSMDEGKSFITANLAVAMAQSGKRVVLIDGDMRKPHQHELFEIENQAGFSDLLTQPTARIDAILVSGPVAGLRLMTAGQQRANPAELLAGPRLKNVIADLKRIADVVIIDTPPLLAVSDALLLAGVADNALIVAAAGRTRSEALQNAHAIISQSRVNLLGIVLNGITERLRFQAYVPYVAEPDAARPRNMPATERSLD